ncbi:MAG: M23 family metallopeptidase [Endomicrobium sp.]|jgi:murein DD-endopeptidase MepM/ murein hydrolase activator NlpD|nr:M23 family metallopeptidase [Endomicrobium sp.]
MSIAIKKKLTYKLKLTTLVIAFFLILVNHKIGNAICNVEKFVIQYGDTLLGKLSNSKLSKEDIKLIIRKFQGVINLNQCIPGDFCEIIFDCKTNHWKEFTYYSLRNNKEYYSLLNNANKINVEQREYETEVTIFQQQGTIKSSLWSEMSLHNVPSNIIIAFADIFAWKMDFVTDTKKGDTFKVIYAIEYLKKRYVILSSRIVAAQYKTSTQTYNAFYFDTKHNVDNSTYFDETGQSLKSTFLKAPLQFSRISSFFTKKRMHPILKYVRPHLGIDYAAPIGTPVSAIGPGIVIKLSNTGDFGNLIVIKHFNGYETYYGHLLKFETNLKNGDRVIEGQIIGYVGMTGLATGPHLDFRIKKHGTFLNFLKIKQIPNVILTNEEKKYFYSKIKDIIAIFDND